MEANIQKQDSSHHTEASVKIEHQEEIHIKREPEDGDSEILCGHCYAYFSEIGLLDHRLNDIMEEYSY